ncbi:acyl-CoA dehydrogenase family protein [Jannaschia sp. W003]|uniref:acyl-CoA dehydrogenase family protein n=1 Tax=Jannaschia sp. W003 TaxID=2867012 RepID=UPI0021A387CA|nr:acyl-CoA dehydrogenase family protein [Jannaschia sp. W003]UWQ20263.1 acyl-CoA dehydrogenase family protein [Jannaschia sp. W003]
MEVLNQPPRLGDVDLAAGDAALRDGIAAAGADADRLRAFGLRAGRGEAREWSRLANENPPTLRTHDRFGRRIDAVEFHPAYHDLMALGLEGGVASAAWEEGGTHATHAALLYLMTQADAGVVCPMSMTHAAQAALPAAPQIAATWAPLACEPAYDPRAVPADGKRAATIGMAMTERQGGSDVRANVTRAEADGATWRLHGHKWFCSAPMSDAFLTLAQTEAGLSCFLVPRWTDEGANAIRLQRLKPKLGDRSNASAEIEYDGARAELVGEEGRGVAAIMPMVMATRLDCVAGSAAGMRMAVTRALHHAAHRTAFQRRLVDQPAMRALLADLCLEVEAAVALMMRCAAEVDAVSPLARALVPAAKYWVCKRQAGVVQEAMEAHGGNGFVEDWPMARLFRQSPLNAIWEGSGNVIALDLLRVLARERAAVEALVAWLDGALEGDPALARWKGWLAPGALDEAQARAFAEETAVLAQAAALGGEAREAFRAARLDREARGLGYGTVVLPEAWLIGRAMPVAAERPARVVL